MEHCAPTARNPGAGQLLLWVNCPVTEMLERVKRTLPGLLSVTVTGPTVLPTGWFPKATLVCDSATTGVLKKIEIIPPELETAIPPELFPPKSPLAIEVGQDVVAKFTAELKVPLPAPSRTEMIPDPLGHVGSSRDL
jgi:hypothetical protein